MKSTKTNGNASSLPVLSPEQMALLEKFARLEVSLETLQNALVGIMECKFSAHERFLHQKYVVPEVGILVSADTIRNALTKKRLNVVTKQELEYWASMLLMNDAYLFDPSDEDRISEWLDKIGAGEGLTLT